jgi:hypothetical protein
MSRNWIIAGVAAVCFITGVALFGLSILDVELPPTLRR